MENKVKYFGKKAYTFWSAHEMAKKLLSSKDTTINFTFDDEMLYREPSGWYGVKIIPSIFDEYRGLLAIGYYGGGATKATELKSGTVDEIAELLQKYWNYEYGSNVNFVCVEVKTVKVNVISATLAMKETTEKNKEEKHKCEYNPAEKFADFINYIDFKVDKCADKFRLIDCTSVNRSGIQSYRFTCAEEIAAALREYVMDYYISPIKTIFHSMGFRVIELDPLDETDAICKKMLNMREDFLLYSQWQSFFDKWKDYYELFDLIANHIDEVDLETVVELT